MPPRPKREEDPSNDNRPGGLKSNSGKFGDVDKKGTTRLSSEGNNQSDDPKGSNSGSNSDNSKSSGSSNGSDSNKSSVSNTSFGGGSSGGSTESNGVGIDNSPTVSTPAADTPSRSSDTTSTSSPAPTPSKSGNAKPPQCFSCIADNDARVLYSGPWTLNSAKFFTSHSTTTSGSSLSLVFNGTGIVVFGTVPPSNSTHPPPSASYTIDADPPFTTNEPLATETIRFQPLFKVSSLSASEHRIFINVTGAETPYTIDSFFIVPGPSAAGLADAKDGAGPTISSDPTPSTPPNAPSIPSSSDFPPPGSRKTAQVVGGVLGGLFFLVLLIVFGLFLERRRRRRRQGNPSGMAWFDKYIRQSTVPAPTIFTSTESIMQATPSSLWSTFSRSDRQSLATFSSKIAPKVRGPPPLPPKPRTRLSLPIIGVDHQIP